MEVVAVVGEALISAALSTILDELTSSSDLLKFARQEKVLTEIKKWRTKLLKINAVLLDAEERQMRSDEHVKVWLRDLRDISYDVEDILDEFNTEVLHRKLITEPQASTSKVRSLVPSCFTSLNPSAVTFNVRMGSKLKEVTARLEEIVKEKNDLALMDNVGGISQRTTTERLPTTSLVGESRVFGRKGDEEAIVKSLLGCDEASNDEFSVISIVGMGGLGKTTLSQCVYNDDRVKTCFELKAWVCVSDDFDVTGITKTILQSVTSETCDFKDLGLNLLQEKLKEKLSGKKFLIVLDDVWNEKKARWGVLCKPFRTGVPGCKIVVTTRNDRVASTMGTDLVYRLQELSEEESLSLLEKYALGTRRFDEFPDLKEIGIEIVKKCKGLPLAVKTLGGVLCSKRNRRDEWEAVLESKIWELPENENDILPALKLSYHHLPSSLKRCFAYCSLFPKDYEFDKNELVLLWMAEGFLHQPKGKKQMEDLGCEYFDDLFSRSFFQQSSADKSRYVMHDLINDLAQFIAEEVCTRLEDKKESSDQYKLSEKARHLSFIPCSYEVSKRFEVFSDVKRLRTFLSLPTNRGRRNHLSDKVMCDLLQKFKCLRALSLSSYLISKLSNSIGDLKHLRYLNLSHSRITRLPDSVSALYNLQTLILCGCESLTELPVGIKNLLDLQHLDIAGTTELKKMPSQIGNLTRLRVLSKFIVGNGDELQIRELKALSHLQGKLSIYGLNNVRDVQDARVANLKEKHGLVELTLQWSDQFDDSRNEEDERQVLESLKPHQNLEKLKIISYSGNEFPCWVSDPLFDKITHVTLSGCKKSKSLPSLGGLPLLKHLYIAGMDGVERVGPEFYGGGWPSIKPFPYLETLEFADMLGWEEWSCCSSTVKDETEGKFPRLRELKLRNCPKLTGKLPSHLPALIKLEIYQSPLLSDSLERLPSLHEFALEGCNEVVLSNAVDFTSLNIIKALKIKDCSELKCLWQNGAELGKLTCLRSLVIERCPRLVSLAGEEEGLLPCNLEDLQVKDCGNLEKLPNALHSLTCLRQLTIRRCRKLVSFPETGWPYTLRHLMIYDCEALERLPDGMMMHGNNSNQSLLEELEIEKCPCLKSFPRGKLPTTLKKLKIIDCENLESLPEGMMHDDNDGNRTCHLEELVIRGCSSLTSFPTGEFPANLKKLEIWSCKQLDSISERMLQNHKSLEKITIGNCENITNLPLECLHSLTYLSDLSIRGCPALESFPERGFSIPTLKSFSIQNCENLKSLPRQMPPNLTSLLIGNCKNLKQPMIDWGLNTLTSLIYFQIGGPCLPAIDMVSFPDDDCRTLPTTLTLLEIWGLQNLESLSRGLRNLPSLQRLFIRGCPKIRAFPKEGLPASLEELYIMNCPLLKQRCLKEKGDYWPTIAHIPRILIWENTQQQQQQQRMIRKRQRS